MRPLKPLALILRGTPNSVLARPLTLGWNRMKLYGLRETSGRLRVMFSLSVLPRSVRLGSVIDRKSTRLNSRHPVNSYAVFCLKKDHVTALSYTSQDHLFTLSAGFFCLLGLPGGKRTARSCDLAHEYRLGARRRSVFFFNRRLPPGHVPSY